MHPCTPSVNPEARTILCTISAPFLCPLSPQACPVAPMVSLPSPLPEPIYRKDPRFIHI